MDRLLQTSGSWPMLTKETTMFSTKIQTITKFSTRVKQGYHMFRHQVTAVPVSLALTAVSQALSLDTGVNPLRVIGCNKFLHQIKVMLDEWKKEDPSTMKKLPIEVDIPEYLVEMVVYKEACDGKKSMSDLTLIIFYYLLQVDEYLCKRKRNDEK